MSSCRSVYSPHPSRRRTAFCCWLRGLLGASLLLAVGSLLWGCRYAVPDLSGQSLSREAKDSLKYLYERHYTLGANFVLKADSSVLARLPIKDDYIVLHRGDHVAVAEFAVHPADSVDSVWVKLAHTQEAQGWLREKDLEADYVPTDGISQAIYLFSDTHASYFVAVFALFAAVYLLQAFRRKRLQVVYFNDIESVYPLFLCLLVAFSATVYESMQVFVPDTWEHFYYNPTLSPFDVPFVLSLFLLSFWLMLAVFLAVLDDLFRQSSPFAAFCYLLGLLSCCIFCYFFFIFTTSVYIGYGFLLLFVVAFARRVARSVRYKYRCGYCGEKLRDKGRCPRCGRMNG